MTTRADPLEKRITFGKALGSIFIIYFVASIVALLVISMPPFATGNVAIIDLQGIIVTEGTPASLFSVGTLGSSDYVDLIEEADSNDRFDAIVLRINSPGGSPVASREIVEALSEVDKPVVAYIRESGASGAYWAAAAADTIIADPLAITGSVGVRASYLEFSGLFDRYGIDYVQTNGGEYKDLGTPFKNLTDDERAVLMERIDYLHGYFFDSVVELRNISDNESLERIRTGVFFIGDEAIELGLIDSLGSWDDVEDALGTHGVEDVRYAPMQGDDPALFGLPSLSMDLARSLGSGIGSALRDPSPSLT